MKSSTTHHSPLTNQAMQSAQFQLHAQIEQDHWWFVARREILGRIVREVLPPGQGVLVVDVGCGTGANIAALADDYRCAGIDTSDEAIHLAQRRFPRVHFLVGQAPADLGSLAAEARLFLLTDVLEHVADDFAMLSQLLAAAAPGALFLITVPADMALWSQHDVSFGHYRRYTLRQLANVWDGLPVRTRLLSYYNARLYPLVRLVRALNRRRERASGAAGTDFVRPSRPMNWLLRRIFAGEQRRLVQQLRGATAPGFTRGVSLIALLERQAGEIAVRSALASEAECAVH
jgi:2-polyprenyl-3-methyl-5-hydroxy-6-metoxy-1,4-benzoquinol methylase